MEKFTDIPRNFWRSLWSLWKYVHGETPFWPECPIEFEDKKKMQLETDMSVNVSLRMLGWREGRDTVNVSMGKLENKQKEKKKEGK